MPRASCRFLGRAVILRCPASTVHTLATATGLRRRSADATLDVHALHVTEYARSCLARARAVCGCNEDAGTAFRRRQAYDAPAAHPQASQRQRSRCCRFRPHCGRIKIRRARLARSPCTAQVPRRAHRWFRHRRGRRRLPCSPPVGQYFFRGPQPPCASDHRLPTSAHRPPRNRDEHGTQGSWLQAAFTSSSSSSSTSSAASMHPPRPQRYFPPAKVGSAAVRPQSLAWVSLPVRIGVAVQQVRRAAAGKKPPSTSRAERLSRGAPHSRIKHDVARSVDSPWHPRRSSALWPRSCTTPRRHTLPAKLRGVQSRRAPLRFSPSTERPVRHVSRPIAFFIPTSWMRQ